jgi:hypothetical protein
MLVTMPRPRPKLTQIFDHLDVDGGQDEVWFEFGALGISERSPDKQVQIRGWH